MRIFRHSILTPFAAAILTGLAAASCASDSGEPTPPTDQTTTPGTITINLSAAPCGTAQTRATANFTDDELAETAASANELINNWVVAFIRGTEIVAIVDGQPGSGGTSKPSGVWNDRVELELPRGTYSAVALANLDQEEVKKHLPEILGNGNWKDHVYEMALMHSDNSLIPMSGYLENFTVQGSVNEEFAIEVVRMKAKIEYAVKNLSTKKIDLQSFTLTPVYTGDIYLFPDYDKKPLPNTQNPTYEPRHPESAEGTEAYEALTVSAPTGFILEPNTTTPKRGNFYIQESVATGNHPTDRFHIGLRLKRGDEAAEDVSYALADDALKFIHRNDYILFPIVVSDYVPEFEVIDFPPIGGYPVTVEAVNNEFYATFSNSGAFDISARLRDSRGRTVAIQPYDATATQANYVKYDGTVNTDGTVNPNGMTLTYDRALGVWQGNFPQGTNQHITLKFEFKIDNLVYTRTLHLISK